MCTLMTISSVHAISEQDFVDDSDNVCPLEEAFDPAPAYSQSDEEGGYDTEPLGGETFSALAAGGRPVGSLQACSDLCSRATVGDSSGIWNLACYNMCAGGRALGCAGWLEKCTAGNFFGIGSACAVKKAKELCLLTYNALCFGK